MWLRAHTDLAQPSNSLGQCLRRSCQHPVPSSFYNCEGYFGNRRIFVEPFPARNMFLRPSALPHINLCSVGVSSRANSVCWVTCLRTQTGSVSTWSESHRPKSGTLSNIACHSLQLNFFVCEYAWRSILYLPVALGICLSADCFFERSCAAFRGPCGQSTRQNSNPFN